MTLSSITMQAGSTLAAGGASAQAQAPTRIELGWGATLGDIGAFDRSLQNAVHRVEARPSLEVSDSAKALMRPFDQVNTEAASLATDAQAAKESARELTPGELVSLTARCQMFMFHCQLTSNIANRTSDGLQQLFRQQS